MWAIKNRYWFLDSGPEYNNFCFLSKIDPCLVSDLYRYDNSNGTGTYAQKNNKFIYDSIQAAGPLWQFFWPALQGQRKSGELKITVNPELLI